ncbi:hypothetical protein [Sphingobium bisphenolivorans]|uniref:hypothetical protein n=1 Tax=Sphingobium bisphenolivorans TaxID=1335760 RepID=UPI00039C7330|nr:hypothetical protein [Sphingobium bisphenolivorans]
MTDKTSGARGRADNDLNDEPPAPSHSGSGGGGTARDVGSRDEEKTAMGGDPEPTRATKQDKVQPDTATRSDNKGAGTS